MKSESINCKGINRNFRWDVTDDFLTKIKNAKRDREDVSEIPVAYFYVGYALLEITLTDEYNLSLDLYIQGYQGRKSRLAASGKSYKHFGSDILGFNQNTELHLLQTNIRRRITKLARMYPEFANELYGKKPIPKW